MLNVLNGGAHAKNSIDFQEFMLDARRCRLLRARRCAGGARPTTRSARVLAERGLSTAVGDEGGFAPDLPQNEDAVKLLMEAIEAAGRVPGEEIAIALDPATSELWDDGAYVLAGEGRTLSPAELVDYWVELVERYPIVSIEDGMAEEDWDGWAAHTEALGGRVQLVGDDIFVTNAEILERGITRRGGQRHPGQAEPDRHAHRDPRHGGPRHPLLLRRRDLAPLGRDRGHDDRRPRGRGQRGPDQGGRAGPLGSRGEVQPAAPDRGGPRRVGDLPRGRRVVGRGRCPTWPGLAHVAARAGKATSVRHVPSVPDGSCARTSARPGSASRPRLLFLGAVIVSAVVFFAWFPAGTLLSQRSTLAATEAKLAALHKQDAALAQEKKNLSDVGEIERIARRAVPVGQPRPAGLRGAPAIGCGGRRHPVRRGSRFGRARHPVGHARSSHPAA